jgi:hypothetical protein
MFLISLSNPSGLYEQEGEPKQGEARDPKDDVQSQDDAEPERH